MSFIFGICLILIGLTYAEVHITSQRELTEETMNGFLTCVSQLDLNIDTCTDLLNTKLDLSHNKYDGCKCLFPCVSKIIGTMDHKNGNWDEKKYWEYVSLIEIPEWKEEAQIIGKNCADKVNTHCSAGYPLFQCVLKHSKMIQNMANNFMTQKQADIDDANSTNVEYEEESS